jgi:hypothetical protein
VTTSTFWSFSAGARGCLCGEERNSCRLGRAVQDVPVKKEGHLSVAPSLREETAPPGTTVPSQQSSKVLGCAVIGVTAAGRHQ